MKREGEKKGEGIGGEGGKDWEGEMIRGEGRGLEGREEERRDEEGPWKPSWMHSFFPLVFIFLAVKNFSSLLKTAAGLCPSSINSSIPSLLKQLLKGFDAHSQVEQSLWVGVPIGLSPLTLINLFLKEGKPQKQQAHLCSFPA